MVSEVVGRRKCLVVSVGGVLIGGMKPVVIQSMTSVDTANVQSTVSQVKGLARAGAELVRLAVNTDAAAKALPHIKEALLKQGVNVPLVGDFHYNGHKLLEKYPQCGETLAKLRINPGNVGRGKKRDRQFGEIVQCACRYDLPIRIGVNWGSLDQVLLQHRMDNLSEDEKNRGADRVIQETLIESALTSAAFATSFGMPKNRIVLSCKLSEVRPLVQVYTKLAKLCEYPLHIGLTEAGIGRRGVVASVAALAVLLEKGIGDTVRVSLTPTVGQSRNEEVLVAREILQSLGLRYYKPQLTSCPGCGRTNDSFYRKLAEEVEKYVDLRMPCWSRQHKGVERMKVAVMGCVVNGPGEGKIADVGISLPGSGEKPCAPVYIDGRKSTTLSGENIVTDFKSIIEKYVITHYPV